MLTGEVPGLELVDVDDGDGVELEGSSGDLALQVVQGQLLVGGVESESGTQGCSIANHDDD